VALGQFFRELNFFELLLGGTMQGGVGGAVAVENKFFTAVLRAGILVWPPRGAATQKGGIPA
jgi:hypothetical protein